MKSLENDEGSGFTNICTTITVNVMKDYMCPYTFCTMNSLLHDIEDIYRAGVYARVINANISIGAETIRLETHINVVCFYCTWSSQLLHLQVPKTTVLMCLSTLKCRSVTTWRCREEKYKSRLTQESFISVWLKPYCILTSNRVWIVLSNRCLTYFKYIQQSLDIVRCTKVKCIVSRLVKLLLPSILTQNVNHWDEELSLDLAPRFLAGLVQTVRHLCTSVMQLLCRMSE